MGQKKKSFLGKKAVTKGKKAKKAVMKAKPAPPMSRRWTPGKLETAKYYWDEDLPADVESLDKGESTHGALFPPQGMDLSDA